MSLSRKTQNTVGLVFRYPTDMALVSIIAIVAYVLVTSYPEASGLRFVATIAFVAFLPGYALVSALFPAKARPRRREGASAFEGRPGGIDSIERVALGLGTSIAMVPMVVLVLPFTQWGLAAEPIVTALAALTVGFAQIAAVRRLRVPEDDRFTVSLAGVAGRFTRSDESVAATATTAVLVLAVIAAAGVLLYAFASPMAAGGFTELGLYTEDDDGELVAGEFPETVASDESIPVTVQIQNHERQEMDYTVVVQEQVIEDDEVVERTELDAFDVSAQDGEMSTLESGIEPTATTNEPVRIVVLLYEGDEPFEPTTDTAMEYTYFWVTVEDESVDE